MALKVVNCGRPLADKSMFESAGIELVEQQVGALTPKDEYIELLRDADGAMIGTLPLTDVDVLEACSKIKVVSRAGVGVDSIDLPAATRLGILACNTPAVNTTEVADHAMAQLLALTRMIREFDSVVKAGKWSTATQEVRALAPGLKRIAGSTVGIVGLGNIGKGFASRVRGFGPFRIVAYDPYIPQTAADLFGVELVDFDELLTVSDFITVHAPATDETNHIFSTDAFKRMKPSAILINCARGPLVDPEALHVALTSGEITAAALDVTEQEPIDAEDPLLGLDNLIITPHIAAGSPVTAVEGGRRQAENVLMVLTGEAPHGLANPEVIKAIAVMRATDPGRWEGVPDFSTALQL
jgi:D-3-phosphoglycerate dehydrogenase